MRSLLLFERNLNGLFEGGHIEVRQAIIENVRSVSINSSALFIGGFSGGE